MSDQEYVDIRVPIDQTVPCPRCDGCGKLADDDEGTPWSFWLDLPLKSAAAVTMGLVKPIPCPDCDGKGRVLR